MERRASERLSVDTSSSAGSNDSYNERETWMCRSTMGAFSDESDEGDRDDDFDEDEEACRWSQLHTPSPSSDQTAASMHREDRNANNTQANTDSGDVRELEAFEARSLKHQASAWLPHRTKARLGPLAGFSNSHALKTYLPRTNSKHYQADRHRRKSSAVYRRKWSLDQSLATIDEVTPSSEDVEANKRKWDLERKLQESTGFGELTEEVDTVRRRQDLKRKLQDMDDTTPSAEEAERSRQKWDLETKLQDMNDLSQAELKISVDEDMGRKLQLGGFLSPGAGASDRVPTVFRMASMLGYVLLFSSTATFHCAIFNFSLELRRFLGLDVYPFGVLLLASWSIVGLVSFAGGLIGDLMRDRVVLLRRIAVIWGVAVVAFHVAAFQVEPVLSTVCLVSAFLCSSIAHGILCPNVIALAAQSNLLIRPVTPFPPSPGEEDEDEDNDDDEGDTSGEEESDTESVSSCSSDETVESSEQPKQECDLASHRYFSGCFAATMAGSSFVQGYYFLLVNLSMPTDDETATLASRRGFVCMLAMSFMLMAALIVFCFQSRDHPQHDKLNQEPYRQMYTAERDHELKFEHLEAAAGSNNASSSWSWNTLVSLCNRVTVGYALLGFSIMLLVGVGCTLVAMLVVPQPSFSLRLTAFLLILFGWLFTLVASSRQLNPKKKKLFRECRRLGMGSRQLYLGILAIAFSCSSACIAFLRAQLYTTMVVQVCQTRLAIPGTDTLFDPEILGAVVGASSLLLLALAQVVPKKKTFLRQDLSSSADKISTTSTGTPGTPTTIPPLGFKPQGQPQSPSSSMPLVPRVASFPPATRMSIAALLYIVGVFSSSIVELYRRKSSLNASVAPRTCGELHSDFAFLWTLPQLVLLGISDALFRVSLQEEFHTLARHSGALYDGDSPSVFPMESSSLRWAGLIQGFISLAETLGFAAALALAAMLSPWLFRPAPTDLALLFLLLTTVAALTYALLKRVAARAHDYQVY